MKKIIQNIARKFGAKTPKPSSFYFYDLQSPSWSSTQYPSASIECYQKNVIANRCINLIASSAANIDWMLCNVKNGEIVKDHHILRLLHHPNPLQGGAEFFESLYSHKLLAGNAYILAIKNKNQETKELYTLRPDRVEILQSNSLLPSGYKYTVSGVDKIFAADYITGKSDILHIKNFHPLNDLYGLSQVDAAAYSIDLHNQASKWNKALLQNGARPSGALILKTDSQSGHSLTEEQFARLKIQMEEQFNGTINTGKPILLEGGLDWKEMSLTPKDMDFIEAKNSAARDIALAFGVPPQLLGIPGDNTFSNLQEARLAFWEETVIPMVDKTVDALNNWMVVHAAANLRLRYDSTNITALSAKHDRIWNRVKDAAFMTDSEKRVAVGLKN